jgi:hypothetical protein
VGDVEEGASKREMPEREMVKRETMTNVVMVEFFPCLNLSEE